LGGVFGAVVTAPLEVVKTRLQVGERTSTKNRQKSFTRSLVKVFLILLFCRLQSTNKLYNRVSSLDLVQFWHYGSYVEEIQLIRLIL
jgi:protein-S-isoprenylcysteine O-methyltransferase Ste14